MSYTHELYPRFINTHTKGRSQFLLFESRARSSAPKVGEPEDYQWLYREHCLASESTAFEYCAAPCRSQKVLKKRRDAYATKSTHACYYFSLTTFTAERRINYPKDVLARTTSTSHTTDGQDTLSTSKNPGAAHTVTVTTTTTRILRPGPGFSNSPNLAARILSPTTPNMPRTS